MPRKGENIFKRKDGRWEARYISHYENGKAKYKYLYGKTYTEVKNKKIEQIQKIKPDIHIPIKKDIPFQTIAFMWLNHIKNTVKESTYTRYVQNIEQYLNPNLQDIPIEKINIEIVNNLINYLLEKGGKNKTKLSAKTVSDILCILKSILKYAAQNEYTNMDYTCIKYPQRNKKEISIINEEDRNKIQTILFHASDPYSISLLLALYTGIRIGELCGLQWKNINLQTKTIHITQTIERIKNLDKTQPNKTKIIINTPKTQNSIREIPLPNFLMEILQTHQQNKNNYILTGTTKYMEPHQCYMKYKKFLKDNHIQSYSFHTLRHTFATMCIEAGFDTKSLSEILGHSNITTTLNIYVHPTLEQKRKQMEKLNPFI